MELIANQLTEDEVFQRLNECRDPEKRDIVDELYGFGLMLVKNVVDDNAAINKKAGAFAAYSGAIITLLVSSFGAWSAVANLGVYLFMFLAGLAAFVTAILSVRSLSLRQYEWFSQKEWLESSHFDNLQKLKRYRILTMWGVIASYRKVYAMKTSCMLTAQRILSLSVLLLLVALLCSSAGAFLQHGFWLSWSQISHYLGCLTR